MNEQNTEVKTEKEIAEVKAPAKPAKPAKTPRKKVSKKRQIQRIALALMIVVLVCLSYLLYRLTTADARFLREMSRGLNASWMLENGEVELQNRDAVHSTEFIDLEYEAVKDYRDADFHSKKLKTLALSYIKALRQCKSVAESQDPEKDFDAFWAEFSKPYADRLVAVYKIYKGGYGLVLDDEESGSVDDKGNLLAQGWILSKAGDIEFTRQESEDGVISYYAELKNDSGFDLEFLDLEVELYNKKGKLVETASAYAENIKKGDTIELIFYQSSASDMAQYRIISEICRVKSADSPEAPAEAGAEETPEEGAVDEADAAAEEKTGSD